MSQTLRRRADPKRKMDWFCVFCYGDEENARIYAVHLTTANQREIRVAYFALGQKNRLTGFRAKLIMVHGQLYKKYKGFLKWRKEQQDTFYG